jgi:hypothetical protein
VDMVLDFVSGEQDLIGVEGVAVLVVSSWGLSGPI